MTITAWTLTVRRLITTAGGVVTAAALLLGSAGPATAAPSAPSLYQRVVAAADIAGDKTPVVVDDPVSVMETTTTSCPSGTTKRTAKVGILTNGNPR